MFSFLKRKRGVYADYASATPLDPTVKKEIERSFSFFGNPASIHSFGRDAKEALEEARVKIARLFQTQADEIVFTSGGTESNNLAIFGFAHASGTSLSIITSGIEHSSILEPIRALEGKGAHVTYLPVNDQGRISQIDLKNELEKAKGIVLVSLAYANGEIGTIEDVRGIGRIIKGYKEKKAVYFHTDASQAAAFLRILPNDLFVDLLTVDASKIYGPKGAGLLFVKRGTPLSPLFRGGGQERGVRPGTENVSGAVGLASALTLADSYRERETKRLEILRDSLKEKILAYVPNASVNGAGSILPNFLNVCIPSIDAEFFAVRLDSLGIALSSASACRSISGSGSSYVIESLPGRAGCGKSSLRISLGRNSKGSDVEKIADAIRSLLS